MDPGTVDAVLLDMDGTLVDSDAAVERSWFAWAGEYGVDRQTAQHGIMHGSPAEHTVRRLRPDLDEDAVQVATGRQLALEYRDLSDVVPTTGAHDLVSTLERLGLPWAVVTSADKVLADLRLRAAGIHPPLLITVDDVRFGKPDPEGYLMAARRLGVDPARCLVVEDAEPGVQAGRAAGCTVAALKGVDGDLPISDLRQLTATLTPLIGRSQ